MPGETLVGFSVLFNFLGVCFAIAGIYTATTFDPANKLVGGDAYDLIIRAARGAAWVGLGVASIMLGVCFALYALIRRQRV